MLVPAYLSLAQQLHALETVPDSYIVVSPKLVILTASNAYLADTLKRREDLVGATCSTPFPTTRPHPRPMPYATGAPRLNASLPLESLTKWRYNTMTCSTPNGLGTSWNATGCRAIRPCLTTRAN
jgi:hypothetical protein